MNDIVERLRAPRYPDMRQSRLQVEAAGEIERLRKVVDAAVRWRRYNPERIPGVVPQAMHITTRVDLMEAIDRYIADAPDQVAQR